MMLSYVICGMLFLSFSCAGVCGRLELLSAAALEGAADAVSLCLSLCGTVCLWSGVMELMKRCGLAEKLSSLLRPPLRRLFPKADEDTVAMESLSQNVSANLLGLGNAATPAGIRAAMRMKEHYSKSSASDELCMLVVLNTASIQLIPATVAALRGSLGSESPFDILPAVWLASVCALAAGIGAAKLFSKLSKP